jgi:hypothetical protein
MAIASTGVSLGAIVAAPLYATFSVGVGIILCATLIAITGVIGLFRYGLSEPASSAVASSQG